METAYAHIEGRSENLPTAPSPHLPPLLDNEHYVKLAVPATPPAGPLPVYDRTAPSECDPATALAHSTLSDSGPDRSYAGNGPAGVAREGIGSVRRARRLIGGSPARGCGRSADHRR
ncbi:hypothetical protein Mro03_62360 [Microbispora rosea subsp. rosea]|nr:hypothetical protein Mro03_62360 [Microbispora rosea subsp. rosea]